MITMIQTLLARVRAFLTKLSSRSHPDGSRVTDVMLDLETLGTRPGCKILAIGAVVFGPDGLGKEFYTPVDHGSQVMMDPPDPSTVEWWARQSKEAQAAVFDVEGAPTLPVALTKFNSWLASVAVADARGKLLVNVWGNGADFDNPILGEAYHRTNMSQPRSHYSNRCYRTLKNLAPEVPLTSRIGTHHNALDDAKSQAVHAVNLMRHLRVWG